MFIPSSLRRGALRGRGGEDGVFVCSLSNDVPPWGRGRFGRAYFDAGLIAPCIKWWC